MTIRLSKLPMFGGYEFVDSYITNPRCQIRPLVTNQINKAVGV